MKGKADSFPSLVLQPNKRNDTSERVDMRKNEEENKKKDVMPEFHKQKYNHTLIERLYRENYSYFFRIANSLLHNDSDAKDAVQTSFLKLYNYMNKISNFSCPEIVAYFVSVVKSVSINMIKEKNKVLSSPFSEDIIGEETISETIETILEQAIKKEELENILADLSIIERNILELKLIEGYPFKEISKHLGLTEEASKKRYQRTLKKLQEKRKEE